MRALLLTLTLAALATTSASMPASADSTISVLRETEGLATGRFPAMDQVDCVEPYCIHNPDGSLNAQASTEALERAQDYTRNGRDAFGANGLPSSARHGADRVSHDLPGLISGRAIADKLSAPPATTAPQLGLFSTLHNIER